MKVAIQKKGKLKLTICSPVKASKIVGISADTIRRHINNKKEAYMTDDHFIFLDIETI